MPARRKFTFRNAFAAHAGRAFYGCGHAAAAKKLWPANHVRKKKCASTFQLDSLKFISHL